MLISYFHSWAFPENINDTNTSSKGTFPFEKHVLSFLFDIHFLWSFSQLTGQRKWIKK